jgi:hypothetical protein
MNVAVTVGRNGPSWATELGKFSAERRVMKKTSAEGELKEQSVCNCGYSR